MPDGVLLEGLKPYPLLKESGLPWLGMIPESWRVLRAKSVFTVIDVRSQTGAEELLTVSSNDGVLPRSQKTVTMFKAESYVGHKLCWPGDLVINSLWAWMQGLGFSRHHGLVSSAYSVYRPRPAFAAYSDYLHYVLRSAAYKWELQTRSKGVWLSRLQLSDQAFLDMPIILPSTNEHRRIVTFVNHVDKRTRRYIGTKQRLIRLLEEQKQSVIQHAVTGGYSKNSKQKIETITGVNQIPHGWTVRRLRTLIKSIEQGVSPQAEAALADYQSWGVLKSGCVNRGVFRDSEHKRLSNSFIVDPSLAVRVGDIIVSRASGSPQLVGSAARVTKLKYKLILSDKTFRLNLVDSRLSDFLVAAMNTKYFRYQVEQAISGAEGLANNLPVSSLKDFYIVVPPVDEAKEIVSRLASGTGAVNKLLDTTRDEIDLMRDYRARVISDVVTGKLDVRASERNLAEEVPSSEESIAGDEELEVADDAVSEEAEA